MKVTNLKFSLLVITLLAFTQINAQDKKRERPTPEKMFEQLDTNEDKSISLEEFKARKRRGKEVKAEEQEKRFKKMDADSNGSISLEEFIEADKERRKNRENRKK